MTDEKQKCVWERGLPGYLLFVRLTVILSVGLVAFVAWAVAPFAIEADRLPAIVIAKDFRPFVGKAADDLVGDFEKIFGARPEIRFADAGLVSSAIVAARSGSGWKNHTLETKEGDVLRITASDDRGAMFGLYRFASDFLGVNPFFRWNGNVPERAVRREWKDGISLRRGDPSFRFRGWFVNDEDFLNGLSPEENGTRKIDYPRYHVCFGATIADWLYETAVRAGFNLMVCASYVDILNPDEKRLVEIASSRGPYVTMHHQEPAGAGALQLDCHFSEKKNTTYASHSELWRKAWRTYVAEWAKVSDVIWQLGLRGRKDRPFWAVLKPNGWWEGWGVESESEDLRRAKIISDAMSDQLTMIREATGGRPFRTATQLWMEGPTSTAAECWRFRRGRRSCSRTIRRGSSSSPTSAASNCCSELALAVAAREEGNDAAARRHLEAALVPARARDALDRRYASGKWKHRFDRNPFYPYQKVTLGLEAALRAIQR